MRSISKSVIKVMMDETFAYKAQSIFAEALPPTTIGLDGQGLAGKHDKPVD